MPKKLVNILKSYYNNGKCRVSVYNDLTNPFTIQTGVRQGCFLSPMIFNVVIDWIMKSVEAPIFKVTDLNIADLAYADDIVLLGENEEDA